MSESITNSRAFKKWFGKSKVVGATGKPLICFHGTVAKEDFDSFHPMSHFGTVLASNDLIDSHVDIFDVLGIPRGNPRIFPVYLSIVKPLRLNEKAGDGLQQIDGFVRAALTIGVLSKDQSMALEQKNWPARKINFIAMIEAAGYDGFVYTNDVEDKGSNSWIPLHPQQVKSIFAKQFNPASQKLSETIIRP